MDTRRVSRSIALVLTLVSPPCVTRAETPRGDVEREAARLFARLRAPCCYRQTLDVHDSDAASALRDGLRARLASGETVAEIEQDLVRTYGARIRVATHAGLASVGGGALSLVMLASLAAIVLLARRWRARYGDEAPAHDPEGDALVAGWLESSSDSKASR